MVLFICKIGEGVIFEFFFESFSEFVYQQFLSRKWRWQSSVGGVLVLVNMIIFVSFVGIGFVLLILEKVLVIGFCVDFVVFIFFIIKLFVKLFKGKFIFIKQVFINFFDDIIIVQRGGFGQYFD